MYAPETTLTGFGDSVLVIDSDSRVGYKIGKYTGNARPESEAYEISVEDFYTGQTETVFYHKEDLYENTKENAETLKGLTA
mgnify:CR=1 FL=1